MKDAEAVLTPAALSPGDRGWVWTDEWQATETEADEQLARGEGTGYDSDEDFLAPFDADVE